MAFMDDFNALSDADKRAISAGLNAAKTPLQRRVDDFKIPRVFDAQKQRATRITEALTNLQAILAAQDFSGGTGVDFAAYIDTLQGSIAAQKNDIPVDLFAALSVEQQDSTITDAQAMIAAATQIKAGLDQMRASFRAANVDALTKIADFLDARAAKLGACISGATQMVVDYQNATSPA